MEDLRQHARIVSLVICGILVVLLVDLTTGQTGTWTAKAPLLVSIGRVSAAGPTWTPTGSMAVARRDHTATLLTNGKVLVQGWTNQAELYDRTTGVFSATGSTLFGHSQGSTATRLTDGRVLVVGPGIEAEIHDSAAGGFTQTGSTNSRHHFHTATLLPGGKVLIAGGSDFVTGLAIATSELYDPATGAFTLTGALNTPRVGAAAALLPDGRVLVAGGTVTTAPGVGSCTNSAELYDPSSATFSPTANMVTEVCSAWWAGAPVLNNGKVLIVGGLPQSAQLFDPATGTFSLTGSTTTPRNASTATLLQDGRVLVAGGHVAVGPVTTNSAELYDPVTGVFNATASMAQARQQHTATLLQNGTVLVTGGFSGVTELSSAELFALSSQIQVQIDILPGVFPNVLDLSSPGNLPVAILTTSSFNAATVSARTVRFAGAAPVQSALQDVDGDGDLDLLLQFALRRLNLTCASTSATLTGQTNTGATFSGTDSVRIKRDRAGQLCN